MRHGFILVLGILVALLCDASAFATEGVIVDQYVVSARASAQHSIAVWAPPRLQSIRPNLGLLYDSRSGIDSLGIGSQMAAVEAAGRTPDIKPAPCMGAHHLFGEIV
jgi:hypothetical protein